MYTPKQISIWILKNNYLLWNELRLDDTSNKPSRLLQQHTFAIIANIALKCCTD